MEPGREPDDGTGDDPELWLAPDTWLERDSVLAVGTRTLNAVATPGHTRGHFVFADLDAGILFAGDHVLPSITPSIGLEPAPSALPLGDYLASLAKVRARPDLLLLPAHGAPGASSHARIDQLFAHHEERLGLSLSLVEDDGSTGYTVAQQLPWTRRARAFA